MAPRRSQVSPEGTRVQLMDAALRAFAEKGYDGASVRDIAAEASVAPGLLYHYFPSKAAVLTALFERSGALVMQAFTAASAEPEPAARLAGLIRVSAALVRAHEDFWRVSYGVRFQRSVLDGLAEGIAAQSALYGQLFTELLTALGRPDPAVEARVLFATLDGVFQHYVLDPAQYPLDAVIEHVIAAHGGATQGASPAQTPPNRADLEGT